MNISAKFATLGLSTVILAIAVLGVINFTNNSNKTVPLVYSEKDMLEEVWTSYKQRNIEAGTGRTLDREQDAITTSEGQSYTMLQAVWMDDQKTFDSSWQWTKDNLQRDDFLMSWKFGRLPDGSYGIQNNVNGQNSASDGDSDIALSLLMAYSRWKQDKYLYDALPIISSIWEREVVRIDDKPVLVANDLERNNLEKVIVNPSYFAPYAYKVFARVDKNNDWNGLADNSYALLKQMGELPLDSSRSSGLPPDWVTINRQTGAIEAIDNPNLTTRFGFDAIRVPWRLALDYKWFGDERSREILKSYTLLGSEWQNKGQIVASYNHDGSRAVDYQTTATYGAAIGYFSIVDSKSARDIYKNKLLTQYDPDRQRSSESLSYYDANWLWFGMALYLNELPNLTASKQGDVNE